MPHLLLETGDVLLNENGLDGIGMEDGYTSVISADAPVAHWRLGESSGTTAVERVAGRNGAYVNTPTLGVTGPLYGDTNTAVTFVKASQEYVQIPLSTVWQVPTTGELSVEFWANLPATAGSNFEWLISNSLVSGGLASSGWVIQANDATPGVQLYVIGYNTGTDIGNVVTNTFTAGAWHHFVATMDNSPMVMHWYVDGVLSESSSTPMSTTVQANTTDDLFFGQFDAGFRYLGGSLDEIAIYPAVLTAAQVNAHWMAAVAARGHDTRIRQAVRRAATI